MASGTITTFYSYKGGTGRTMALANTACVLAEQLAGSAEKLLVVDWDLEAPGLHRFFPPRLRGNENSLDLGLDAGPGLIDLFIDLRDRLPAEPAASEDAADAAIETAMAALDWPSYIGQTEHAQIHILRAGRNDDGQYGKRVNTFDWEGLHRRAPGIYRAFAERLARDYRWVLIDSRTGVTDISGICTALLPEKLVVVFTPNRQSLTGVRELVLRATAYRRGSDDLRPLLVLPLPSRIEASMEKLRTQWRHGQPEEHITGYQPMFEALLAECYGLPECKLGEYFDAVQIQQSPDCAYGEVISVRAGSGDRFSLASSYRVFVERLTAEQPPWQTASAAPIPVDFDPFADATLGGAAPTTTAAPLPDLDAFFDLMQPGTVTRPPTIRPLDERTITRPPLRMPGADPFAAALGSAAGAVRPMVFLSYAAEDRERVGRIVPGLQARGLEVYYDRNLRPGERWDDVIADALDKADVVVVFWSRPALASESVRDCAEEGLRRGIVVPVLLDDARPPVSFRAVQAFDLRRDFEAQLPRLIADIERIARAGPGDRTMIVARPPPLLDPVTAARATPLPPTMAAPPSRLPEAPARGAGRPLLAVAALVVAAVGIGVGWRVLAPASGGVAPPPTAASAASAPIAAVPRSITVPDLTGRRTDLVNEVASVLDLKIVMSDESGLVAQSFVQGTVVAQQPRAGAQVEPGTTLRLTVAAKTVTVPSLGGLTLDGALAQLKGSGLELGEVQTVAGSKARPGTVVLQVPQAGSALPQGAKVKVGVASDRAASYPSSGNAAMRKP